MTNIDSILKSRDITLPTKVYLVKALVFPVVTYGCETWTINKAERLRNWCFWTVVLEKTLESPLDCIIKPVNPKGNQSWIFIGRTDAEVETPILWPPDAKSWLIRKDPDAGNDWRQKEKGTAEDEMVREHHWLNIGIRIWANSGKWWRTGKPGVLQSMGLQRVWTWLSQQKAINNVYVSKLLFQFIPPSPSLPLSTSLSLLLHCK